MPVALIIYNSFILHFIRMYGTAFSELCRPEAVHCRCRQADHRPQPGTDTAAVQQPDNSPQPGAHTTGMEEGDIITNLQPL